MTILIALTGYLAGLIGSAFGAFINTGKIKNRKNAWFIFILHFQVMVSWPIQLAKVAIAIIFASSFSGTNHPFIYTGVSCVAAGLVLMIILPRLTAWLNSRSSR